MWELILTAVGLAADAFSLSLCKGLAAPVITARHMLISALYFGGFQALMPIFGYLLGEKFRRFVESVDHWIAFSLLLCVGLGMILESLQKKEAADASFSMKKMLPLALSSSIDALAVGITFSIERVDMIAACLLIGGITACLCAAGVKLGCRIGKKYSSAAQCIGGILLILMGVKLLIKHLA